MRVSAVTIRRTLFREMSVFHIIFGWTTQTLIFLLSLLFIVFLCYCLYIKHIHMKYDHIPGPPRDSFFLGHSPTLLRIGKDNQVIYDKFLEWALVYGSVYRMNLLHYVFICVTCPEATKGILMSPKFPKDKFVYKRLFNLFGQRFLGNGLITAQDYDQWYKMRRIMDPAFSSLYLKGLMGAFNETAEKLMDKLTEIADEKKEANMLHLLNRVIMDVLTKESMTKEDEECMLDNFMTFFIAGQETTTNQLAFCVMELARHPDILEKAKKEADEVIGMKQDMNYDDLGQLSYLSQVLKETLRIYPTAPSTYRELVEDIVIGSFHIPRGVTCLFSSFVTGRMDQFFKDPLTFDPDRFHPEAPKPYYCYYPFALGPRSCLGQNFSQMEAKVVMAKLLQRFDFPLVPGQTFDILDEWCATSDTGLRRNKMQQNPITDLPSCSSQTS